MSRRPIRAGRAEIYVGLNDSELIRDFRNMESRMQTWSQSLKSFGTKALGVGATMAAGLTFPVKAASQYQEAFSKFNVVFGENSKAVKKWSDDFADSIGRSRLQIVQFMGQAQDTFIPLGFEPGAAEAMSKQITQLAIDLASFNGYSDEEAFRSLMSSIVGNTENLRKFGVVAQKTQIKAQAALMGFDPANLTAYEKALAIIEITMKGTTAAQGDAIATAHEFANQLKAVKSEVTNLAVATGTVLLEPLSTIGATMREVIRSGSAFVSKNNELTVAIASVSAGSIAMGVGLLTAGLALQMYSTATTIAGGVTSTLRATILATKVVLAVATTAWIALQAALWGVTIASVASYKAITAYGVRASIAKAATIAWTVAKVSARSAMMLLTNAVAISKVATGAYIVVTTAAAAATAIFAGRLIAGGLATRGLLAGMLMVRSAMAGTTVAIVSGTAAQAAAAAASNLLSGSLYGQAAAAIASVSAAVTSSTAWTVAAGVISTAYGIITSPVSLLVAAFIGIVSAVGVAAAAMAAFEVGSSAVGKAFAHIKSVLVGFFRIAKETFGGIRDALAAGQYMLAVKILWAGIKQAFWFGIKKTIDAFRLLPSTLMQMTKDFTSAFVSKLVAVFKAIPDLLMGALSGKSLGDMLASIMGAGDWLDGVATDKLIDARNELNELTDAAKQFRKEKNAADEMRAEEQRQEAMSKAMAETSNPTLPEDTSETDSPLDVQSRIDALRQEILELERGAEAADLYQLSQEGASAEEIEAIRTLNERKRALEAARQAEEDAKDAMLNRLEKLADRAADNGRDPREIHRRQLAYIGKKQDDGTLNEEDAYEARKSANEGLERRLDQRRSEADQIRDSLKTPLEKFNDEVRRITGLVSTGDLTKAEGNAAIAAKREKFVETQPKQDEPGTLNTARFGSTEALATLARARGGDGASQAPPWVNPLTHGIQQQVAAAAALPAQIAASTAAATSRAINTAKLEDLTTQSVETQRSMNAALSRIESNTRIEGEEL